MELNGVIIAVLPAKSGVSARTGKPWFTQEYVIETSGQHPKKCCFEVFGEDRIKQFNLQQGQTVSIQIDIDASEYQGRWYNSIKCYNVTHTDLFGQQPAPEPQPVVQEVNEAGTDDLPF